MLALLLLAAATALTFPGTAARSVRRDAAALTFASVEQGTYRDVLELRCTVVPREVIYLDAVEGGRVERVLAQLGDQVQAGQALIELSNTDLELDVLDRQARLIDSITQLQTYQTELEQNHLSNDKALQQIDFDVRRLTRNLARIETLAQQGLVSQEARDTLQEQLDHANALRPLQTRSNREQNALRVRQLPVIESQITALQQDIAMTRAKLGNLTVRAPRAGRVTAIDLRVGESRARGTRLAELTPPTGFHLTARVDEFYLDRVRSGQRAELQFAGRRLALRLERVHPEVREGFFSVDLAFAEGMPSGLRPGQALQPKLLLGDDHPSLVLRAGAFLEASGGHWVFVRNGAHNAERRNIKVGRRNAQQVEIVAGLRAGERVLISDYSDLQHFERIDFE
jgi:HlyD family secretion protein